MVLSPLGKALLTELGTRATTQSLRLHLADYFEPVLLPRRWRFVDQLPHNERGKLTQVALAALFELDDDESPAT